MSGKHIPKGPWNNGIFDDGEEYDAIVHSIEHCAYGKDDDYYFRIVLWLVQEQVFLVTNIYVREDNRAALQRIWHVCQACGTSNEDFYNRLADFKDKHIRVALTTVPAGRSGAANTHSDVARFLKATRPLTEEQWAAYRRATDARADCASTKEKPEKKQRTNDIFAAYNRQMP